MQPPLIALLTDFGTGDTFAGVMKGVIASICNETRVIDLTHAISAQNVREGAFHLDRSIPYFPEGSIFVCIVDPEVGTSRRPIAVQAGQFRFVAPDNGLLTPVLERHPHLRCRLLSDTRYHLATPSSTFHGRDIFCPVAAHLAAGVPFERIGPEVDPATCTRVRMFGSEPLENGNGWKGEVVSIDHFGNVVTSIEASLLVQHAVWSVSAGTARALPVVATYGEVDPGAALAYAGSSGMIEIAVRNGNAARELLIGAGSPVCIRKA